MHSVSKHVWSIGEAMEPHRKQLLLDPISPNALLGQVAREAWWSAANGTLQISWKRSKDQIRYWRIEAIIPVTKPTFDQLFNGRSGYRAQYYLSAQCGRRFNRLLTQKLACAIERTAQHRRLQTLWPKIEKSLFGQHSKVWVPGDWAAFIGEQETLQPARWVANWQASDDVHLGLTAPLPSSAAIDFKGTFVSIDQRKSWLPNSKKKRDIQIHQFGWT